jgi:hypothetical protein
MGGDVFLALLAYNIGPRNGGLPAERSSRIAPGRP